MVTLSPQPTGVPQHPIRIFAGWNLTHLREDVLNGVLFAPLGVSSRFAGLSLQRAMALAVGISVLVETLQWAVVPGRFAELQDVVSNTAGALVAFLLVQQLRVLRPEPQQ